MNLKLLRREKKITQQELAFFLKISPRTYCYYETKERDMPTDILIKLADFYKVSIDYLVGRETNYFLDLTRLSNTQRELIEIISNLDFEETKFVDGALKGLLEGKRQEEEKLKGVNR